MSTKSRAADVHPSRWALTPDGDELIVDCSEHGEIGRVPAAGVRGADRDEYGRAAALFREHVRYTSEPDVSLPY